MFLTDQPAGKTILKYLAFLCLLISAISGHAQRYKKIHRNAIVIDTHNDVMGAGIMKGMRLEDDLSDKIHSDFRRFKKGGLDVQVFSIFCDGSFGKDTAFKFANIEIDSLYALAKRNPDKLAIVRNPAELLLAVKEKKLAGLIGVEGGHMIEDSIAYLDSLFSRGARYLSLTWNNSTSWATSAKDESDTTFSRTKGLSDLGKQIIRRMNELGMMVDVSHSGEQTFYDVIAISSKPIIASHSSVYAISPQYRNLKDEQIKAIAKNGGVIQVNFLPSFLDSAYSKRARLFNVKHRRESDSLTKLGWSSSSVGTLFRKKYPKEIKLILPPMSILLDHIDYIVNLVGVDFVGLGSDYDGIGYAPKGLEDVSKYPNITKGLKKRGYSRSDIEKILGGNFIRVFKANIETARFPV
jgi:membrane dipeptidase